jgi:hypothetical protein
MARFSNSWRGTIKRTIPIGQALYFLPHPDQVSLTKAWHKSSSCSDSCGRFIATTAADEGNGRMRDAKLFPLLESSQHITASHDEKKIGDIRHEFENRAIFRENVQLLTPTAPLSAASGNHLG